MKFSPLFVSKNLNGSMRLKELLVVLDRVLDISASRQLSNVRVYPKTKITLDSKIKTLPNFRGMLDKKGQRTHQLGLIL